MDNIAIGWTDNIVISDDFNKNSGGGGHASLLNVLPEPSILEHLIQ